MQPLQQNKMPHINLKRMRVLQMPWRWIFIS